MIDSEFRSLLHDRLGPALDELVAPDLLDRVRTRQVRHKRSVRAGLALSATATVAAVVAAVAIWPSGDSAGPTAPASSVSAPALPSSAGLTSPAPSPSTAVLDMSGVAPLVTSGPCAGLAVAAFLQSRDLHPAATTLTSAGAVFATVGQQMIALRSKGPCVDRLSYVSRTATFQNDLDVPYSFHDGEGAIFSRASVSNQTGVVQLFLDCKGLACSGSGAPLATLTIKASGSAPGATSLPFAAAPTPLPLSTSGVVVVPSVIGLSLDDAERALRAAGLSGIRVATGVNGPARGIVSEETPVGSMVPRGSYIDVFISGEQPLSAAATPGGSVTPPNSAVPSLASPTTARMPVVVGMPAGLAEQILKAAHITYRVIYQVDVDVHATKAGTVLSQSPVAGSLVRPATRVELTVAIDPRAAPPTGGFATLQPN